MMLTINQPISFKRIIAFLLIISALILAGFIAWMSFWVVTIGMANMGLGFTWPASIYGIYWLVLPFCGFLLLAIPGFYLYSDKLKHWMRHKYKIVFVFYLTSIILLTSPVILPALFYAFYKAGSATGGQK